MLDIEKLRDNPPEWALQTLLPPLTRSELPLLALRPPTTEVRSVKVAEILGTLYLEYQDMTWIHALEGMRRSDINLQMLEKNPDYYRSDDPKIQWMLIQIAGRPGYYISSGNHRSVIARFLHHMGFITEVQGVLVETHHLDLALWDAAVKLRQLDCVTKVEPEERGFGPNQAPSLYCQFRVQGELKGERRLTVDGAEALYKRLQSGKGKQTWLKRVKSAFKKEKPPRS